MKAPIEQAGGKTAFPLGCVFHFFWGPQNRKIQKNSDFGWVQIKPCR
jgi:hypothetical protein